MSQSPKIVADDGIVVGLLGPIMIRHQRNEKPINGPKQRSLLAILAMQPGRLVTTDSLVDQAWHGDPPPTAGSAMRVHLARIRKVFADLTGDSALLIFQPPGYRLHESVTTDAAEYERMVMWARSRINEQDHDAAFKTLTDAEKLWRGSAMTGVDDVESLQNEAQRLEDLRLEAQEDWAEVRLSLGHHEALCPTLAAAVGRAPLRERRTAQLMLALHRSGRQADALKACRKLRRTLVDELGIEPGTGVQRLEESILRNDSALVWSPIDHSERMSSGRLSAQRLATRSGARDSEVPQLVRELVADRLARLSPENLRLIHCLAVLEGESSTVTLSIALGLSVVATEMLLEEIFEVGGLCRRVVGPGVVVLQHVQFARAVRDDLPDDELALLHFQCARALQQAAPSANPQRVARHLLAAGEVAPLDDVARAVVLGADQALRLQDADEAAELARHALEVLAGHNGLHAERIDLLLRVVSAESQRGHVEAAQVEWEKALDLARKIADAERFALVILIRNWTRNIIGQDAGDRRLLTEALEMLPAEPSALRMRIASALITEGAVPGRYSQAGSLVDWIDDGAPTQEDQSARLEALFARQVLLRPTPLDGRMGALAEEFKATAEERADPYWSAAADASKLYIAIRMGHKAADVDTILSDMRKNVVRARSGRLSWQLALSECCVAGMFGEFERAEGFADEAAAVGAEAGITDALPATLIHRFLTDFHTKSVAAHAPVLTAMMKQYPGFTLLSAAAALSLAQAGEAGKSSTLIDDLIGTLSDSAPDEALVMAATIAAEATNLLPEAEVNKKNATRRHQLVAILAPYRDEFVVFGQVAGMFGPVERALALLEAPEVDTSVTIGRLRRARRRSSQLGSSIWAIRCAADIVSQLRAKGRRSTGDSIAQRVRPMAVARGLSPVVRSLSEDSLGDFQ